MGDQAEDRWTERKRERLTERERERQKEKERDGARDKREELEFGGWHVFLTKEKKVGNSMRPQIELTEQNESL